MNQKCPTLSATLAESHYENFPVGSLLLPRELRPHVHRLYAFARVADDLADERQSLSELRAWRHATERALQHGEASGAPRLLIDLAQTVRRFALPERLLFRLLDAFERDLRQSRYADMDDLLSYCRDSADPVGRLMLCLFGKAHGRNLALSDQVCTGLQLVNHAQDVRSDYANRGRIYLPQDRLHAHGVTDRDFSLPRCSLGLRAVIGEMVEFAAANLRAGAELPGRLGGRFGLEIRAIITSAMLVVEKLRRIDFDVFLRRPKIQKADTPDILARSLVPWRIP